MKIRQQNITSLKYSYILNSNKNTNPNIFKTSSFPSIKVANKIKTTDIILFKITHNACKENKS